MEQEGGTHSVPAGYLRHSPIPLHRPSFPQVDAPWLMHTPCGSGALATTIVHLPGVPMLHERQAPAHEFSQQTPSTQKVLEQSLPRVQVCPSLLRPHLPATQKRPGAQSVVSTQVEVHPIGSLQA